MADSRSIIAPKGQANTPSIQTGTVALSLNTARSAWAIQNQGTAVLFLLMGDGASSSVFHFTLKGSSVNDDGNGATLSQAEGVIYTGSVTVSGSPLRYTVYETS